VDKGLPVEPAQLVTVMPIQLSLHPFDYVEHNRADERIVDAGANTRQQLAQIVQSINAVTSLANQCTTDMICSSSRSRLDLSQARNAQFSSWSSSARRRTSVGSSTHLTSALLGLLPAVYHGSGSATNPVSVTSSIVTLAGVLGAVGQGCAFEGPGLVQLPGGHYGPYQVGPRQAGPAQAGPVQVGPAQVGLGQVGPT
jgi:hypothetical protein